MCDRLVELYLRGGLPVGGTGATAGLLDGYWLGRAERLGRDERGELFARVAGPAFAHLLGRLATAIAEHAASGPAPGAADDGVGWAADELRSSIDRHVDEAALAAIGLLRPQLGDALAILSDAELLNAYGARDPWQLVDTLSRLELGGTRDIPRHQALAAAGTVVIAWLADGDGTVTEEVADAARSWLAAAGPAHEG